MGQLRWKLIPTLTDGKDRPRVFAYELALISESVGNMPDTEMYRQCDEATVWCHRQFAYGTWRKESWGFSFMHEVDAVAFKVRWG